MACKEHEISPVAVLVSSVLVGVGKFHDAFIARSILGSGAFSAVADIRMGFGVDGVVDGGDRMRRTRDNG